MHLLRMVGTPRDVLRARFAAERALGGVSLTPPTLPPGAIVCVRHLRARLDARQTRTVAEQLEDALRGLVPFMARPFRGIVPTDANAVVFFDEAELLACLAQDWHRGDGDRWWWRSLYREVATLSVVERAFAGSARSMPAVLSRLDELGIACDVVRHLPAEHCNELSAAVAESFAVREWTHPSAPSPRSGAAPQAEAREAAVDWAFAVERLVQEMGLSQVVMSLPVAQRALVMLCVALHRAPHRARTTEVIATIRRENWEAVSHAPTADVERESDERATSAEPARAPESSATGLERLRPDPSVAAPPTETILEPTDLRTTANASKTSSGEARVAAAAPISCPVVTEASPPAVVRQYAHQESLDPVYVTTDFAGVVYLLNVALSMELYGDFTQPLRPGLDLTLGDLLALVGEHACGPIIRGDAIWNILAQLAGRRNEDEPRAPDDFSTLVASLVVRTALALDMPEHEALEYLCARPGRVALSATRLDVVFELATHPLAIRVAGLDRDPGWVPAAGRTVALHYE